MLQLGDRHDWHASLSGELSMALTVESAMGLTPPERAVWLRVLIAELARAHSHLSFLAYIPHRIKSPELTAQIRSAKQALREIFCELSGNRVHPMLNRLGGLAQDMTDGLLARIRDTTPRLLDVTDQIDKALASASATLTGIGTLEAHDVLSYGLSGPVAAASGVRIDARDSGYLAYADLPARPDAPLTSGDAMARFTALLSDLRHSMRLVDACADALPGGPVSVSLTKIVKAPEGTFYRELAAPWGTAGCYLVSRGERTPWRLGLRTPTFANCSALPAALIGCPLTAISDIVASLGYGIGDLDR